MWVRQVRRKWPQTDRQHSDRLREPPMGYLGLIQLENKHLGFLPVKHGSISRL
jgi:hypothetical protein